MAVRLSPLCIALGVVVASLAVVGCGDRPAVEASANKLDGNVVIMGHSNGGEADVKSPNTGVRPRS